MRRRLRSNRMGFAHPILLLLLLVGAAVGGLSLVPSGSCNVSATVTMTQTQFVIGSVYTVNTVAAATTGYAPIIDWTGLLGLGFAVPALSATYVLSVSLAGHTTTKTETKFLPTLSLGIANQVVDTLTLAYIPKGNTTVSAVLTVNGQQQGSASQSLSVSC